MARYEVKKLILSGLAGISAQNFERLIFKGHLAFKTGHTVALMALWIKFKAKKTTKKNKKLIAGFEEKNKKLMPQNPEKFKKLLGRIQDFC